MTSAIVLDDVSMVFNPGSSGQVHALADIDLAIEGREFISLIGPSGCGKSTLLRLVGDLLAPTAGTVEVNGRTAAEARLEREYGMVFQSATLLEWRKILPNVVLPLEVMGMAPEERDRRGREMLDLVQLGGFADHYPWQLVRWDATESRYRPGARF